MRIRRAVRTFNNDLTVTSLNTLGNAFSLALNGSNTSVTNAANLTNSGTVSFGDGGDSLTFTNGVTHTAGANVVNGNISTTASPISLDNNATGTRVNGTSTLAAASGQISLGDTVLANN